MPTYEYRCASCGQHIEVVQSFTDEPLTECVCSGPLRKVFAPVGIVFKGSGFYKTDSRSSGRRDVKEKDAKQKKELAASSSESSSPASTAKDSRPASTAKDSKIA